MLDEGHSPLPPTPSIWDVPLGSFVNPREKNLVAALPVNKVPSDVRFVDNRSYLDFNIGGIIPTPNYNPT